MCNRKRCNIGVNIGNSMLLSTRDTQINTEEKELLQ
ncbi:MAG: hypothetical protein K0R78_3860 [Pelosinus sp.]|jgi:hypothetical protein|nr:hypothetical protein [Pelosinus sp.]